MLKKGAEIQDFCKNCEYIDVTIFKPTATSFADQESQPHLHMSRAQSSNKHDSQPHLLLIKNPSQIFTWAGLSLQIRKNHSHIFNQMSRAGNHIFRCQDSSYICTVNDQDSQAHLQWAGLTASSSKEQDSQLNLQMSRLTTAFWENQNSQPHLQMSRTHR